MFFSQNCKQIKIQEILLFSRFHSVEKNSKKGKSVAVEGNTIQVLKKILEKKYYRIVELKLILSHFNAK